MTRRLALLFALLFPLTALAERTLTLTVSSLQTGQANVARVPVSTPLVYMAQVTTTTPEHGVLEVDVPGTITGLWANNELSCTEGHPVRCTFAPGLPYAHAAMQVMTTATIPGTNTATARLDTLSAIATVDVVDRPSLTTHTSYGHYRVEPGQSWQFGAETVNHGATATNVVLTGTLTNGGRFTAVRETGNAHAVCTFTDTVVTCKAATLPYNGFINVTADLVAPDTRDGGVVHADAKATADQPDFDPSDDTAPYDVVLVRHIAVTSANDEGSGTFRQALIDAAVLCATDPCTIEFPPERIAIKVQSPLPAVRGVVKIQGVAELDGSALTEGAGLLLRDGCEMQVFGLYIHGFPGAGIDARRGTQPNPCNASVSTKFPATEIAHNRLEQNERGLVVSGTDFISIYDNEFTLNRRSGLFADANYYLDLYENDFSNNGGSGLFLNTGMLGAFGGAVEVHGNRVANNGEWGIALTNRGDVQMVNNSISGNRHLGIDVNLDFETPNVADDTTTTPNKPVLVSAVYDPAANTTTVRGTIDTRSTGSSSFTIQVYSSPRPGEGEVVVAERMWNQTPPSDFTFVLSGDLRGRYITATNTRTHFLGLIGREAPTGLLSLSPADTSEFSNALKVE